MRKTKCLYYSTNARLAAKNLKNWCAFIPIKSFVPIAAARRNAIIRGRCIRQQVRQVKSVPETAKRAAVASKALKKVFNISAQNGNFWAVFLFFFPL